MRPRMCFLGLGPRNAEVTFWSIFLWGGHVGGYKLWNQMRSKIDIVSRSCLVYFWGQLPATHNEGPRVIAGGKIDTVHLIQKTLKRETPCAAPNARRQGLNLGPMLCPNALPNFPRKTNSFIADCYTRLRPTIALNGRPAASLPGGGGGRTWLQHTAPPVDGRGYGGRRRTPRPGARTVRASPGWAWGGRARLEETDRNTGGAALGGNGACRCPEATVVHQTAWVEVGPAAGNR